MIISNYFAGYSTSRLPKISDSLIDHISVGKFLQPTKRSCPRRNQILGEQFSRFAIRLKIYTDANRMDRCNKNLMHQNYQNKMQKLDLNHTEIYETNHIKLPTTGQQLAESISKSLSKWKHNAHDEIRVVFFVLFQISLHFRTTTKTNTFIFTEIVQRFTSKK